MEILSVEKRRKHLCLVKTADTEQLIDDDTVIIYGLKSGMTIDDELFCEIVYHSEFTRAKSRALWLMDMRDYSKKELITKLSAHFSKNAVIDAVETLADGGIVDDERFARVYAEELSEYKGASRQNIRIKLMQKGIDREIIDAVIDNLPDDEIPQIIDIIGRKYANNFDDDKLKRRMIDGLLRKGYKFTDIKKAMDEYIEHREEL